MQSRTLSHYLERRDLQAQLTGGHAAEVVIGVGRDPNDARRNCILLYVPQGFAGDVPDSVTLGGEEVAVVRRERGSGPLLAYRAQGDSIRGGCRGAVS